ncbi:Uncharacterised protein [Mycobacteroides abscessus subsp. abscessus]|nr:Uncharacterised protein [Mycobacteroides abscessus subsp. abscessus]
MSTSSSSQRAADIRYAPGSMSGRDPLSSAHAVNMMEHPIGLVRLDRAQGTHMDGFLSPSSRSNVTTPLMWQPTAGRAAAQRSGEAVCDYWSRSACPPV